MFLLIWLAVLFAGRINANSSGCTEQKEQAATLNCTNHAQKKPWSCKSEHNETSNWWSLGVESNLNVTINLSAERNGTNVTCRMNLTEAILKKKPVTLYLFSGADLRNSHNLSMRNETRPTSNSRAQQPNTTTNGSHSYGKSSETEDPMMKLIENVKKTEVICAFLIGFLLATLVSTVVCCLMRKSHRKKMKIYGNLSDALEMINDPEATAGPGGSAAGHSDVDYSTIKFSGVRAKKSEEAAETEYAEIKREEMVQEEEEEEEAITGEVEVQMEAESAGMMEDEDAALCPDVEVVGEMEACSA